MTIPRTRFPTAASGLSAGLASDRVLLDGMTVLFDQTAALTPIDLTAEPGDAPRPRSRAPHSANLSRRR